MSREKILSAILQNQPVLTPLPSLEGLNQSTHDPSVQFKNVLQSIGGEAVEVGDYQAIESFIEQHYKPNSRITTTLPDLSNIAETDIIFDLLLALSV